MATPRSTSHLLDAPERRALDARARRNAGGRARDGRALSSSDERVRRAFEEVPRHRFFPAGVDTSIPPDQPVPLGQGRMIPPVDVVMMMLRALELAGTERVLDIGGGSGYQAALLSRLAREVVSVEVDAELATRAASLLRELGWHNVRVIHADASSGWAEGAPYQAIVVGAAAPELPPALVEQLELGGRLVIPLGDSEAQLIERLRKRIDSLDSQTIGACHVDVLSNRLRMPSSFPWTKR